MLFCQKLTLNIQGYTIRSNRLEEISRISPNYIQFVRLIFHLSWIIIIPINLLGGMIMEALMNIKSLHWIFILLRSVKTSELSRYV